MNHARKVVKLAKANPAVTAAVTGAVAAPIAIPAAVGALGFGAGGIAAGSVGAWMMSLGAGSTPAIVATMQSIGATGAISAATQGLVGAASAAAAKWWWK